MVNNYGAGKESCFPKRWKLFLFCLFYLLLFPPTPVSPGRLSMNSQPLLRKLQVPSQGELTCHPFHIPHKPQLFSRKLASPLLPLHPPPQPPEAHARMPGTRAHASVGPPGPAGCPPAPTSCPPGGQGKGWDTAVAADMAPTPELQLLWAWGVGREGKRRGRICTAHQPSVKLEPGRGWTDPELP